MVQGAKYGAIGGGTQAGLNILTMGTAYVLDREYGNFGKYKPVYRRGTFITRALAGGGGTGVALGRNLVINEMSELEAAVSGVDRQKVNNFLRAHEIGHYWQQGKMGFGVFYERTIIEYIKYGIPNVYSTPGTLEYMADQYALSLLGYKY